MKIYKNPKKIMKTIDSINKKPIGYLYLTNLLNSKGVKTIELYNQSFLANIGDNKIEETSDKTIHLYRKDKYSIEDTIFGHLEFALKQEGVNLEIIKKLFEIIPENDVLDYIKIKPKSKYNRIVWFLYEWLTNKKLNIENLKSINYVDVLDSNIFYAGKPIKHKRYCVNENLLGNKIFCPAVKKTNLIKDFQNKDLKEKAQKIISDYDPKIIYRAVNFLYSKESKSSFAIENEYPAKDRLVRFQKLLEKASLEKFELNKESLLHLQNLIVNEKYKETDYRNLQIFVGSSSIDSIYVDYIAPKQSDVPELMQGFLECYKKLMESNLPPVIIAGILAFGFVYIHPFQDGNGRIHRFLIHYIYSKTQFTPENVLFPVSATMLRNRKLYDKALEAFSERLMPLIDYAFNKEKLMEVKDDAIDYYRYIDLTKQTEYLYECTKETIEGDFLSEVRYLYCYDKAKAEIQHYIDMPDNLIDLFITFVVENKGKLSNNKRKKHFSEVTDKEIQKLEKYVNKHFENYYRV